MRSTPALKLLLRARVQRGKRADDAALHCSMTSFGLLAMKSGEPMTAAEVLQDGWQGHDFFVVKKLHHGDCRDGRTRVDLDVAGLPVGIVLAQDHCAGARDDPTP